MFERTEEFESYIAPARRYPQIWRLVLGVPTAIAVYVGLSAIGFAGLAIFASSDFQRQVANDLGSGSDPQTMYVLLGSFFAMGLGAVVAACWHFRGFRSLTGAFGAVIRDFGRTLVVTIPVFVLSGILISLATDLTGVPQMDFGRWLLLLIPAIPLLIVQTGAEELFFRGYLTQQLAARFGSFLIWGLVPSILFGLAHYSGEFGPLVAGLIVLATGFFGLVATDLTRVTGNLGAALAFHFTNNFFALFLVAVPDQLSGLALYLAPFTMDDTGIIIPLILVDMIVIGIVWRILRRRLA